MKRIVIVLMILILTVFMAACKGNETALETSMPEAENETPHQSETDGGAKMLVAYFSYGENADLPAGADASTSASIQVRNDELTGNTGLIAGMIADATGADLFSIKTVEKYPGTYEETINKGQEENNANARPELATHIDNLGDYHVIFLGFPNWWYDMPMAVYSFLEEVDLSGKTVIPFVTSGGSGFSDTISTIADMEPNAAVQEGISISGDSAPDAKNEIESWLKDSGYMK